MYRRNSIPALSRRVAAVVIALTATDGHAAEVAAAGRLHLVVEIDRADLESQDVDSLRVEVRDALRRAAISVPAPPEPIQRGLKIVLPAADDRSKAIKALRPLSRSLPGGAASLDVRDDGPGVRVEVTQAALDTHVRTTATQTVEILRRRLSAAGISESRVERSGNDRIDVEVPEPATTAKLQMLLAKQAKLELRRVLKPDEPLGDGEILQADGNTEQSSWRVERRAILSGDDILDVQRGTDPQVGMPVIDIRLSAAAAERFGRFTTENMDRSVAMVLDGWVLSAPIIRSPITGGALQISGNFTTETADNLALLLRTGALPAKLRMVSMSRVGADRK